MNLGKLLLEIVKKFEFEIASRLGTVPNQMNSVFKRKNLSCFRPKAEIAITYFLESSKF